MDRGEEEWEQGISREAGVSSQLQSTHKHKRGVSNVHRSRGHGHHKKTHRWYFQTPLAFIPPPNNAPLNHTLPAPKNTWKSNHAIHAIPNVPCHVVICGLSWMLLLCQMDQVPMRRAGNPRQNIATWCRVRPEALAWGLAKDVGWRVQIPISYGVKVELSDLGIRVGRFCERVVPTVGYGTQAQSLKERVRCEPSKGGRVVREDGNPGGQCQELQQFLVLSPYTSRLCGKGRTATEAYQHFIEIGLEGGRRPRGTASCNSPARWFLQ